jgi:hypothetical protein
MKKLSHVSGPCVPITSNMLKNTAAEGFYSEGKKEAETKQMVGWY